MVLHNKFQCHYRLLINWIDDNGQPQQEIVQDPITVEFDVIKSMRSENSARITVYNLDASTREFLYQDIIMLNNSEYIKWITLEAGYEAKEGYREPLTLVCWGYVKQCFSVRNGVDFITTIEVIDPDVLTEYCGVTFEAGTTFQQAYDYLIAQLPSLKRGETGVLQGEFKVPTVFDGNAFVLVNKLTGGHTYIDNGVVNTLQDNETLSDYECYYIAADTGLLETPKRYDTVLEINMLFEPTIKLGQLVEIKSSTQARFDGQYKVVGINHKCLISGAVDGARTTTLQLQYIYGWVNSNINLTQEPQGNPPSEIKNNKVEPINTNIGSDARAVYKHLKDTLGKIPNKMINSAISWKNMIGNNNTNSERFRQLTAGKLQACTEIANRVVQFRDRYFPGRTITITSGWRSVENNAREGGVSNSQHLTGRAVDMKIAGVTPSTVAQKAIASKMFVFVKKYDTWIHVDIRKV